MTKADKRKTLLATIKAKGAEREKALDAIPDSLTDDEYKAEEDRIYAEYKKEADKLWMEYRTLFFKAVRNDWMIRFVDSFGPGEHKITCKQFQLFAKYGEYDKDMNGYGATAGNLFYIANCGVNGGYVNITRI